MPGSKQSNKKKGKTVSVTVQMKPKGSTQGKKKSNNSSSTPLMRNTSYPKSYFSTGSGAAGEMIVKGLEVLNEINTTPNFNLSVNQSISPANQSLFPKLSAITRTFEQYHFRKLRFHYVSGCPTTTAGSVLQYIDYDIADEPAPNAIALLANQTAVVKSVANDSAIVYDTSRQMLPKMYVASTTTDIGSLRQTYAGWYRLVTDKGAASPVFAGYIYVEYECCFYTPKPPSPSGGVANSTNTSQIIPPGSTISPPFQNITDEVGLPGGTTSSATSSYASAGGIIGYLDYARQVYEAGSWLVNGYATLTGASSVSADAKSVVPRLNLNSVRSHIDDDHYSFRSFSSLQPEVKSEEKVPSGSSLDLLRRRKKCVLTSSPSESVWAGQVIMVMNDPINTDPAKRLGSLASGDVVSGFTVFDVSAGNMDVNFPVTSNGMYPIYTSNIVYAGSTAPVNANYSFPMVVPKGKRYAVQPFIQIGPTTARTVSNYTLATQSAGVSDI